MPSTVLRYVCMSVYILCMYAGALQQDGGLCGDGDDVCGVSYHQLPGLEGRSNDDSRYDGLTCKLLTNILLSSCQYVHTTGLLPAYIHTYTHTHACIHTYSNRTSTLTALQSLKYTYIHKYIRTYIHISILYNLTLLSIVGLPVLRRCDLRRFGLSEGSSNGSVCGLSAERLIEGHQICHIRSYKGDDIHTSGKNISQPYIHIQFKVCIHYT